VAGQTLDSRSDLFSLGIILYELLSGTKPFNGDTISTILHAITHNAHTPFSEFERDIPACCQEIVDKLLAKELDERFDSAAQLSKAVEHCMAELPSSSPEAAVDVCQFQVSETGSTTEKIR